jgi:ABC-type branched-subunit amino acid transport system ATPase component
MMLQLQNVSRRFGGVDALRDINLSIDSGELVGLIGPNGSGKSTLVNVVSGVLRASRGTVLFRNVDITAARTSRIVGLGISRNFQSPRLFWELSIRRNIEIAELEFARRSEMMHRFIDDHLPILKSRLDFPAQTMSLFEQKKLEIALRLASRPALMLLDEPAAGLSPSEQVELIHILKALNATPCAVLVIEHSMSVIFQTCQRVLVLRGGLLIADDNPAAVARNEAVIEAYLGPGAMQFLQ